MKQSKPRIKSVKFKNGGSVTALPVSNRNYKRLDFGWGEVVFRVYDNKELRLSDIYYMADIAKETAYNEAQE